MGWAAALRAGAVVAALAGALTCCSGAAVQPAGAPSPAEQPTQQQSSNQQQSSQQPPTAAPADVQRQVQLAIDAFNGKAGGSVSGQQAVLADLLDEGQRAEQDKCAAATTTLRFEPVYARLAPSPGWKPSRGALYGTVYALPTLIRVFTGNRITGTDLTDLHIAVQDGRARFPALCLN